MMKCYNNGVQDGMGIIERKCTLPTGWGGTWINLPCVTYTEEEKDET